LVIHQLISHLIKAAARSVITFGYVFKALFGTWLSRQPKRKTARHIDAQNTATHYTATTSTPQEVFEQKFCASENTVFRPQTGPDSLALGGPRRLHRGHLCVLWKPALRLQQAKPSNTRGRR
jgi:hypothetical protein